MMKKLTIGLGFFLLTLSANAFAAVAAGTSPFNVCIPSLCGGFNFGFIGLFWQPTTDHLDYALRYPNVTPLDPADPFGPFDPIFQNGRYQSVLPHLNWGFRVSVGYIPPCTGNDIVLAYTQFDHEDKEASQRGNTILLANLATEAVSGTILFPEVIFPFDAPFVTIDLLNDIFAFFGDGTPVGGVPVQLASGKDKFDYHTYDLEFGQYMSLGCNTRLRWFGGLRYTVLNDRFDANYTGFLLDVDVTDAVNAAVGVPAVGLALLTLDASILTRQKSDFEGIGPRLGLNASYHIWRGLGIVGEGSLALLVGELTSNFKEVFHTTSVLTEVLFFPIPGSATAVVVNDEFENYHHPDETRIVPNLEGKIGIDYAYMFCNALHSKLTLEAGYMVTHYFNTVDRLTDIPEVVPELRPRHTIDTSFGGPYAALQFQF